MLRLYNTDGRKVQPFVPLEPGRARLYTCGPTVYNFAHIGNLRTYVFEDILKRVLRRCGYQARHVMNITDVGHLTSDGDVGEDKMEVGAARERKTVWEIRDFFTAAFMADAKDLRLDPPDTTCRATDHIAEQIAMVRELESKGIAYPLADGLYFDTAKFPGYGRMAGLDPEGLMAGARVEVAEGKRNITDFCLWKLTAPGVKRLMEWDSPWGRGFPGWHIECSAMARKFLGDNFDIHCGGIDHVRVHHTNEIAQTEALTGKKWVNWWMHGEFLLLDEGKMSKSSGTFLTLSALKERGYDPLAYRLFLMNAHYRKPLVFSFEALEGAQRALQRLRGRAHKLAAAAGAAPHPGYLQRFDAALEDDLNAPQALAQTWELLHDESVPPAQKVATLASMDEVLQLDVFRTESEKPEPGAGAGMTQNPMVGVLQMSEESLREKIRQLLEQRTEARQAHDFARADALRAEITALGVDIKDSPTGTTWTRRRGHR